MSTEKISGGQYSEIFRLVRNSTEASYYIEFTIFTPFFNDGKMNDPPLRKLTNNMKNNSNDFKVPAIKPLDFEVWPTLKARLQVEEKVQKAPQTPSERIEFTTATTLRLQPLFCIIDLQEMGAAGKDGAIRNVMSVKYLLKTDQYNNLKKLSH
tara:strand:+ start:8091 stop:8549 length:459 start_codon:yes stop_codon:yes gene_type:complete